MQTATGTFICKDSLQDVISRHDQYLQIARDIGIFFDYELKILQDVLADHRLGKSGYFLFEEKQDNKILGFVILGRIPLTVFGWDIYWLVVDKEYQGKGIGKRLMQRAEQFILQDQEKANLRVETSTRKEYSHARTLYVKMNFHEVARIHDFYDQGDDIIIFYKQIQR